jgi:hypothetical protein
VQGDELTSEVDEVDRLGPFEEPAKVNSDPGLPFLFADGDRDVAERVEAFYYRVAVGALERAGYDLAFLVANLVTE